MMLLPTRVEIDNPGAVVEGRKVVLVCRTRGSRPPADLTWTRDGNKLTPDTEAGGFSGSGDTTSQLTLAVGRSDHGANISCTATNPARPRPPLTNATSLVVHYPPVVVARLGSSLDPDHLKEGDDVYFDCQVSANPPSSSVTWYHEGVPQVQNVTQGVILAGDSLALQKVGRRQAGRYSCRAANTLSSATSAPVALRIKYKPECLTSPTTYFIYDKPINVTCTVASFPPVTAIYWQWNNSNERVGSQLSRRHRDPSTDPKAQQGRLEDGDRAWTQLTVRPVASPEDRTLSCWAVNEMGRQTQPCGFTVKVAKTPMPLSSCRLANITASSLSLTCQRPDAPAAGTTTLYRAEVYFENRTLFANVTSHRPNFNVSRLDAGTSYQIKVYVSHGPVTSQPVVVSAYTSRTSRPAAGEAGLGGGEGSVGGVVGGVAVAAGLVAAAVGVRSYCGRRGRGRRRKPDPQRPHSDDSNPDVVPNIEETYDLLAAERKVDTSLYELVDQASPARRAARGGGEAYRPMLLRPQSPLDPEDPPGLRADLYCPVDQLMQAEESVV